MRIIQQSQSFVYTENGMVLKKFREQDLNVGDKIERFGGAVSEVVGKEVTEDGFLVMRWIDTSV